MKDVVIVSPGRTGTSMTARLFDNGGYFFGDELWPRDNSNQEGYFEDKKINALNERLLRQAGVGRPTTRPGRVTRNRWLKEVLNCDAIVANQQVAKIRRLVARNPEMPFCYKDPRFCYTFRVWRPFLADRGPLLFVCVVRDPVATAKSTKKFCRRKFHGMNMPEVNALRIWACMYGHIVDGYSREGDWFFLDYDWLLDSMDYRRASLRALSAKAGAPLNQNVISPLLRNQQGGAGDLARILETAPGLYGTITTLHGELRRRCLQCGQVQSP